MTKHQVADLCGVWQTLAEPSQVFDPMSEVGVRESILLTREDNWVAQEMWSFFSQKGVFRDPQRYAKNLSDVMEIYCSSDSELTKQAQQLGLHAERFCLQRWRSGHHGGSTSAVRATAEKFASEHLGIPEM